MLRMQDDFVPWLFKSTTG